MRYRVRDVDGCIRAWLNATGDRAVRAAVIDYLTAAQDDGIVPSHTWRRGPRAWLHSARVPGTDVVVVYAVTDVPERLILVVALLDI